MENTAKLNQEEKDLMEICLPIWERWLEDLKGQDDSLKHITKAFADLYGISENSRIALMYAAFCGGLGEGIALINRLDQQAGHRSGKPE